MQLRNGDILNLDAIYEDLCRGPENLLIHPDGIALAVLVENSDSLDLLVLEAKDGTNFKTMSNEVIAHIITQAIASF